MSRCRLSVGLAARDHRDHIGCVRRHKRSSQPRLGLFADASYSIRSRRTYAVKYQRPVHAYRDFEGRS